MSDLSPPTPATDVAPLLWTPSPQRCADALITSFSQWLAQERGLHFSDYEALWQWSVDEVEAFWQAVVDFFDLRFHTPPTRMHVDGPMPHVQWLPGAQLNLADQVLRHAGQAGPAILFESEAGGSGELSWAELAKQVGALALTLQQLGVQPGDRVAAYLPNIAQTVVAFLACASVGAVWSMCAPDMGPVSVSDRFRQITPTLLITVDGYRFGGKDHDRRAALDEILATLPSVSHVLWVPHLNPQAEPPPQVQARQWLDWAQALKTEGALAPQPLNADHPLWILYSSGTTGLPKSIVHGHGGILINSMVNMVLHNDLHPGERILWAVNTSWMVWNAHILSLLGGATLVLYDGSVTGAGPDADWGHLWRLAGRYRVNFLGAGAAIHQACMKAGVQPQALADLSALRTVGSTGSPLSTDASQWLQSAVGAEVWLNVVSGGTDLAGGFLVGLPTLPVRVGEMQCRTLGARVEAWNEHGQPVMDEVGELVCTQAIPSMPLYFWGDDDGSRLRESYFDMFQDARGRPVWRHGDWLRLVPRPDAVGGVIYGRSDATINRQGVRMGTAEFYRVVEQFDEVADSLVVDLEFLGRPSWLLLFVQMRPGCSLDDDLCARLRKALRSALSARHAPDEIVAMDAVPRTITGKKLELPVKKLLLGHSVDQVLKRDALAQPQAIDAYVAFAKAYRAR